MMKPGPEKSEESAKNGSSSMSSSGELRLRLLLETKGLAFAAGKAPSASWTTCVCAAASWSGTSR